MTLRQRLRSITFPGPNLHARLRYRILPSHFSRSGTNTRVLDAGCGNGMLSYASWKLGNRVLGLSIKPKEVDGCRHFFNDGMGIPEDRLTFKQWNLYEVEALGLTFDEIICSEVLEHLKRDEDICRSYWNVLKPGGILHLCCPNADHPDNIGKELDPHETGGHVRPGYTLATYRALLEPIGFHIQEVAGIGGPIRQAFNSRIIRMQERGWRVSALVLCLASFLFTWMDPRQPHIPFSIYVKAVKVQQ